MCVVCQATESAAGARLVQSQGGLAQREPDSAAAQVPDGRRRDDRPQSSDVLPVAAASLPARLRRSVIISVKQEA